MSSDKTASSGFIEFLAWLEVNKKRLAIGAAVIAGTAALLAVYRYWHEGRELSASTALLRLRTPLNPSTNTPTVEAAAYLKVAENFSGTEASERAVILGATALFNENKYSDAQTQFDKFLKQHGSSPWAATAAYGVASCLEALDKRDEAITAYLGVTTQFPSDPLALDAKMALARIYETKKQPEMALKMYEELGRPNISSGKKNEALQRKEHLLKVYPSLNKTNLVAAAPLSAASNALVKTVTTAATNLPQITPPAALTPSPVPAQPAPSNAPPAAAKPPAATPPAK